MSLTQLGTLASALSVAGNMVDMSTQHHRTRMHIHFGCWGMSIGVMAFAILANHHKNNNSQSRGAHPVRLGMQQTFPIIYNSILLTFAGYDRKGQFAFYVFNLSSSLWVYSCFESTHYSKSMKLSSVVLSLFGLFLLLNK